MAHAGQYSLRRLCKAMAVHPSGYYAWQAQPLSPRAQDDQRLLGLLKQAWWESCGVYGYRKLTLDMRYLGERCGKHRVARLLKAEGLRSQSSYRRRPAVHAGKPSVVAPNHLQRRFTVDGPNQSWVTDITYIRTHEGWLYLSAIIDLWLRMVVGWSIGAAHRYPIGAGCLADGAVATPPAPAVLIHSDQGVSSPATPGRAFCASTTRCAA
jgi:putative transposase